MSDRELEAIRRKKLLELRKILASKAETEPKKKTDSKEVLNRLFVGRAWEVLNAAKLQYPQAAAYVENTLVKLIKLGKIRNPITGEDLYGLFRRLGFRVRLQTRIQILEHGKVKSLVDKIKEDTL